MVYIFSVQFLFLCLFLFFGYIVGKALLKKFYFFSAEESCAFSILFGWAIFAFILMFLGFLGLLRAFNIFTASMATFIFCLFIVIRNRCLFYKHKNLAVRDGSDLFPSMKINLIILLFLIFLFYISYLSLRSSFFWKTIHNT